MSNLRRDARCLIRQREPIRCWQLCFPTRFNELHKVARHASRRSFRFLSKPVAPVLRSQTIIDVENSPASAHSRKLIKSLPLSDFAPLRAIISGASVAIHVAHTHLIGQGVLGENSLYGFN